MRGTTIVRCSYIMLALSIASVVRLSAHEARAYRVPQQTTAQQTPAPANTPSTPVPGISGQGKMKFRLLYTSEHLPDDAKKVVVKAHGGFAVDRRAGKGETYFALPGAGIIQI